MKFSFTFLFTMIIFQSQTKSCAGFYTFKCQLINKINNSVIINDEVNIEGEKYKTDLTGSVTIKIFYETSESSCLLKKIYENKKLNKQYIKINYGDSFYFIKNKWRKYGKHFCFRSELQKTYFIILEV